MDRPEARGRWQRLPATGPAAALLALSAPALALDPPLQIAQYAHTSWTARDGATLGLVFAMAQTPDGCLWIAGSFGLFRFDGLRFMPWQPPDGQLQPHRFQRAGHPGDWLADREIKANKLLRDRDGGLWIGSEGLGLIHVKDGQADRFSRAESLSGNIACSLFEDREGNVWYGSERGIDRFRKLPVATISKQPGLPDEVTRSIVATRDGSIWVATNDGLARWKDHHPRIYHESDGLPDGHVQSQYEDADGRLWVSTAKGLAYFADERFVPVDGGPSTEIYAITGEAAGNLWVSGDKGLGRLNGGRLVKHLPWASLGRSRHARIIVADRGGLWMSFWDGSGVSYFKDGRIEVTFPFESRPGHGLISGLRLDADGALWAASSAAGLHRIKDGLVTTLGKAQGLPCETVHWSTLDDQGGYGCTPPAACCGSRPRTWPPGSPTRTTAWRRGSGVPLTVTPPGLFSPPAARRPDGKLWFIAGASGNEACREAPARKETR